MTTGRKIRTQYKILRFLAAGLLLLLSVTAIYFVGGYSRVQAERQLTQKAAETLAVQTEILAGILEKYRLLPPLLTRQDDIAELFDNSLPEEARSRDARIKAEEVAGMSGAREVSFFLPDGHLLASARNIYQTSEDGSTELIDAARQGRLGRLAVDLGKPDRAYAFSAGVRRGNQLIGVVVVYVGFEGIEATWSLSANPIFVTDKTGTVILTNRPHWRLHKAADILGDGKSNIPIRNLQRDLPILTWELHVLSSLGPAVASGYAAGAATALIFVAMAIGIVLVINRREQGELQLRKERALALRLERIVRDRTRQLSSINATLSYEVDERRHAEEKLRTTQAELIQTAKLAVLGQMAATLSHEMNQPLAAIRTYAANATRFLELSRFEDAVATLHRISAMVDRMAELSGALLSFSRKPSREMRPVLLSSTLDEALILVRPRALKSGVTIREPANAGELYLLGGRIRLSQVFVNLFNNAIDAMGPHGGEIGMSAERRGEYLFIRVADTGPGIPPHLADQIFDPFFTTKPPGEGIGVGLSIVYNIVQEFGGTIRLVEQDAPGCTFEIVLRAARGDEK